jgi:hypothetical protein
MSIAGKKFQRPDCNFASRFKTNQQHLKKLKKRDLVLGNSSKDFYTFQFQVK